MSSGSDQRVRHVAIVLQSLDAATSRGLLGQLPPAQSKLVRQAMVNLGTVTAKERAAAFEAMQGLLASAGVGQSSQKRNDLLDASHSSPAAALLATQAQGAGDQVEWSHRGAGTGPYDSPSAPSFPIDHSSSLQTMATETLADILQSERPLVIATVINQVSVERATAIVQALPLAVAGATLAALPHLHLTDPAILRDIQQELERKIGQHAPPPQATAEGLAKLQAILAGMPATQHDIWTNAVAQSNPVLAAKLGWRASAPPNRPTQNATYQVTGSSSASPDISFPVAIKPSEQITAPVRPQSINMQVAGKSDPLTGAANASASDIFEEPTILPFARTDTSIASGSTSSPSKERGSIAPLDRLIGLTDRDFVTVLHACQPDTVLKALRGASKEFVSRVERLMPSKDVKRLRIRLNSMGALDAREMEAAQTQISETAENLLAIGRIGALDNVTFTAAA